MKLFRYTYCLLTVAASCLLVGCAADDEGGTGRPTDENGPVKVHLRVQPADAATTRAWTDAANADDKEMMNVWTVVAVNNLDNKVAKIYACKPSGEPDREVDDLVELPTGGAYRFYSFANMSPKVVMSLLGIAGTGAATTRDAGTHYTDPTGGNGGNTDGRVTDYGQNDDTFFTDDNSFPVNTFCDVAFNDGATVTAAAADAKAVNVAGNNFDVDATSNGYGAKGIPMSNVQTITVNNGDNVELVVVRMMAKIELQVYNDRGTDATIERVTLTDLTINTDNNLKLLPSLTGHNTMNVLTHGDIKPNLNGTPSTGDLSLPVNTTVSATTNTTAGTPVKIAFYVNESTIPTNAFKHFFLKIKLQGETEERYVLIDDKNSTGGAEQWNYIARNDYRVIPVVLDNYRLDVVPYDFPPIGVYPCSVKEEDGIYTVSFHDYGHFHLLPQVTDIRTSTQIDFTATAPSGTYAATKWGLVEDDFSQSWGTWTDATKATVYDNESATSPFYRKGYDTSDPTDGDEVGGVPVWYPNNLTTKPQWDPAASANYQPFIFGYIENPGTLTEDKKVYHEFSVYLYKQGMTAPRLMTYRLYMLLDQQQMLPAPLRAAGLRRH